jgi:hypothetical protein
MVKAVVFLISSLFLINPLYGRIITGNSCLIYVMLKAY